MSIEDLKNEPQPISMLESGDKPRKTKEAWWYEEEKGITIVVEPQQNIVQLYIPYPKLKQTLNRLDKS